MSTESARSPAPLEEPPPPAEARRVSLFVRVQGVTKADFVDMDAFVGVVVEGARKHLNMREIMRVETRAPGLPDDTNEAAEQGEPSSKKG